MSFIYVGRLDELKGIRTLFQAWEFLGENAPCLAVCGSGPMEDWCVRHSKGRNIRMMGYVDSSIVRKLMSESLALILPTLLYEGFPMTIPEAFSVGTPVICSDLGNAGSIVREGVTGWKFKAGNAAELAAAVRKCLDSDGALRARVKEEYESKYTPDANYRRLIEIYSEVLNANRSFGPQRR